MYTSELDALQAGATVVTANKRLARTLQHAHSVRQRQAGKAAWPSPDIISWRSWLERLWQESRLRGGQASGYTLINDNAALCLWQLAVSATTDDSSARISHLARQARIAWGLLNEWQGLSADEWTNADLGSDEKAWLRWSGEYRNRCAAEDWTDSERLPALLASDIQAGLFADLPDLYFAGFDEWSPLRRSILDGLIENGVKTTAPSPPSSSMRVSAAVSYCMFPGANEELRAAAYWARARLESEPSLAIGVVVPDLAHRADAVRRLFLDVFAPDWRLAGEPAGLMLNVSYGRMLAELPAVSAALNILQLSTGRAAFSDFSRLLRSHWIAGAAGEADARASLDIRLRETLRIEFGLAAALPQCRAVAPVFATVIESLLEHARRNKRQSAADWAHDFNALLQAVGWPGADSLDSATWQTVKAWNEQLAEFASSAGVLGMLSRNEALAVLRNMAAQKLFQPEGIHAGVQVMGILEAAGHEFDALWVCGMARELWPEPARLNPFVPARLQRRLGMPDSTAGRGLDYARIQAARLRAAAPRLTVSWPAQVDGEPLTPSPLLVVEAEHDSATERNADASTWNALAQAAGVTEWLTYDPPPPWASQRRVRGGARVLSLQAASPLNAFIESRLGAFEMRRPAVGINAMQRGNLTHAALEAFYLAVSDSAAAAALSEDERISRLQTALTRELKQLPGMNEPFMQKLAAFELQQQLRRLEAFLAVDREREPFTVVECEQVHDVVVGPIALQLKLDRLDELSTGHRMVIDYKTGQVDRQSWNPDRPRDLQLPVYATFVAPDAVAIAFAQVSSRGIGYDGVGSGDISLEGLRSPGRRNVVEVKYHYPYTRDVIESWGELRRAWSEVLQRLASDFAAGDFRLDPRNPDSAREQFAVLSRIYDAGLLIPDDSA